jgi:mRNA interferase MazF
MDNIKRGEIFYIARGGATNGSEQFADRPAVVVSNDENNKHSGVIEVVYLTTAPKTDLPTHVIIRSTGRTSTVLCEQVTSVSVDRVNNYIGQVSEQEMKNIDIALMISLAIGEDTKSSKAYREERMRQQEEIERLKAENETLRAEKAECGENTEPHEQVMTSSDAIVKLETERDTYKALYEQLFERLLNGGSRV